MSAWGSFSLLERPFAKEASFLQSTAPSRRAKEAFAKVGGDCSPFLPNFPQRVKKQGCT